jgi:hypothetical protein
MLINLRNALMAGKRTPTPVALRSSGGQYINLGWVPAQRDTVNIVFTVLNNLSGQYAIVFGANCRNNGLDWFQCGCRPNGYNFFSQGGSWSYTKDGEWFSAKGVLTDTPYDGHKCFLFAQGASNSPDWNRRSFMVKQFTATHYGNDVPYMDLRPDKNNGNPCMTDVLSGTKYLNLGTGSFAIEPL